MCMLSANSELAHVHPQVQIRILAVKKLYKSTGGNTCNHSGGLLSSM